MVDNAPYELKATFEVEGEAQKAIVTVSYTPEQCNLSVEYEPGLRADKQNDSIAPAVAHWFVQELSRQMSGEE